MVKITVISDKKAYSQTGTNHRYTTPTGRRNPVSVYTLTPQTRSTRLSPIYRFFDILIRTVCHGSAVHRSQQYSGGCTRGSGARVVGGCHVRVLGGHRGTSPGGVPVTVSLYRSPCHCVTVQVSLSNCTLHRSHCTLHRSPLCHYTGPTVPLHRSHCTHCTTTPVTTAPHTDTPPVSHPDTPPDTPPGTVYHSRA